MSRLLQRPLTRRSRNKKRIYCVKQTLWDTNFGITLQYTVQYEQYVQKHGYSLLQFVGIHHHKHFEILLVT